MIFWELELMLFDISKYVAFAEIWVFSNIYGFLAVNSAPKWTKTVNFGCVWFELKFKILEDFSNAVFVLSETSSGQNFSKIEHNIWGSKQLPKNFEIFWKTKNFLKFTIINAVLMKISTAIYLNKVSHLAKASSVSHIARN